MIKQLLTFFLIAVSCFQVDAQSKFEPEWNVGVGFGPTFSSMSIIPSYPLLRVRSGSITQFHGGFSVRYITEKNLGFIAEINYSQMGWGEDFKEKQYWDVNAKPEEFEYTHQLNYIEIPFMTHIYFGSSKLRGFVNLGPKVGYLVGESQKISESLQNWLNTEPNPNRDAVGHYGKKANKKIDYGIIAGAGMELRTAIGNFTVEGRYYMGFGDIYSSSKSDYFSRSANRTISARVTYYIKVF